MKTPDKSLFLKIFLFIFLSVSGLNTIAQVIYTESFDGTLFPPAGWVNAPINSKWVRRTNGTNPNCLPHSGPAMARFTSFNQPNGTQEVLISPVIDFSGNTGNNPTFSLWIYRDGFSTAGDSLTIYVNTANTLTGATRIGAVARSRFFLLPVNEASDGWYQYTFNVPSTFNTGTNYFLLNGTAIGGGNIYIDDLSWTEYPPLCTGAPSPGSITADQTAICGGSGEANLTLSGASSGFSGIIYQWQNSVSANGPWVDFGTNSTTTGTGVLTNSTYFRCLVSCSASGISDSTNVIYIQVSSGQGPTVMVSPGGVIAYCNGSAPVSIVASGASTYTWTPNISINNGVGDSALAAPANTTTYLIIGTDSVGCIDSAFTTVQVGNSPNVNANAQVSTICEGQSVNLNAFVMGGGFGISYQWNPGAINGQFITVSPTVTTTYIVTASSFQTTCAGIDSVTITVIPAPVAAFSYNANNQIVSFQDNSVNAISWFWDFGDGVTSTDQNPIHIYGAIGNYTVTLTIDDGTCTNTVSQTITITQVGLPQLDGSAGFLMYPNPGTDHITVAFTSSDSEVGVELVNAIGQVILEQRVPEKLPTMYSFTIDISAFAKGIYFIKINSGAGVTVRRFVKQ